MLRRPGTVRCVNDGAAGPAMWVESDVRSAVEDVGREVVRVAALTGDEGRSLGTAWEHLVTLLALGPAPELKACPHCGGVGMLAATRCGTCWRSLTPPAATVAA